MKSLLYVCCALVLSAIAQAASTDPPDSMYHLEAQLTNQAGQPVRLDVYRGSPVLITLFYGSCPTACPLLIDTVRSVERSTSEARRKSLRVLMISVDPEHDTPAALAQLARERRIDASRWTLARTDAATVRKIAALLNIQYRQMPNGGYNHSSIVTLLSPQGEIVMQSSVLGRSDEALLESMGALDHE